MSRIILLDAGPLGLLAQPRPTPSSLACQQWAANLRTAGILLQVAEIADYEVRRELLRARKVRGVQRLNQLNAHLGYVAITTATILQAAAYWAQLRNQGQPTAPDLALDGDVILAAQAALLIGSGHSVTIATTNVGHLSRLVPAEEWQKITH
ncbi:MAG: nuclease [Chloroflexaceae bacterium]